MIEPGQDTFSDNGLREGLQPSFNIEVLCGCDGRYLPHAATMLCSLLENNSVSRIHFFYSSIDSGELAKLKCLVARYESKLACYEMIPEEFKDLRVDKGVSQSSVANYFRLLAPRILPADIDKILYLDSDIIVRRSISDLWNTDLRDRALAAVEDAFWAPDGGYVEMPPGSKYFNSGVLLINLAYWRRNSVYERAMEFIRRNPEKLNYYDQDALNAILVDRWINLPALWNEHARSTLYRAAARNKDVFDPAIVHFVGGDKPWHWSGKHPFTHEYRQYRLKTPWRRYRREIRPLLRSSLRCFARGAICFARAALPSSLRRWLRSGFMSLRA
jgi:lipopolysaccharide biosynthesis glycosyltransferase